MQLSNTDVKYGLVAKSFHWLMFGIIAFLLMMGPIGHELPRGSEERDFIVWLHQSLGITAFFLVILRLVWRLMNKTPSYPASMPKWQRITSSAVHWFLYVAILLQPIAGMLAVRSRGRDAMFFNFRIPGFETPNPDLGRIAWFIHHDLLGKAILVFVIFHIVAALYHHFIVKDNILKRMGWGV